MDINEGLILICFTSCLGCDLVLICCRSYLQQVLLLRTPHKPWTLNGMYIRVHVLGGTWDSMSQVYMFLAVRETVWISGGQEYASTRSVVSQKVTRSPTRKRKNRAQGRRCDASFSLFIYSFYIRLVSSISTSLCKTSSIRGLHDLYKTSSDVIHTYVTPDPVSCRPEEYKATGFYMRPLTRMPQGRVMLHSSNIYVYPYMYIYIWYIRVLYIYSNTYIYIYIYICIRSVCMYVYIYTYIYLYINDDQLYVYYII